MSDPKNWPNLDQNYRLDLQEIEVTAPRFIPNDMTNVTPNEAQQWDQHQQDIVSYVQNRYPTDLWNQKCQELRLLALARYEQIQVEQWGGLLSQQKQSILANWQEPWRRTDGFSNAGGYFDQQIHCMDRYVVHATFSWLEQKYGALADWKDTVANLYGKPIQFAPSNQCGFVSTGLVGQDWGIFYNPAQYQIKFTPGYLYRRRIEQKINLFGIAKGPAPLKNHTLLAHNHAHEYGHVIAHAIARRFFSQLGLGIPLETGQYLLCFSYINHELAERLKKYTEDKLGLV